MYQLYVIEKETIIMEDIQSVVTIKELYSLDQTMAKPLLGGASTYQGFCA